MAQRMPVYLARCAMLLFLCWWVSAQQQSQQPTQSVLLSQQWMDADIQLRLRVTLRNTQFQDARSCQHAFAQVEMHNVHPTESAVIYDVYTSAEETSWVDAASGERHYWGTPRVDLASAAAETDARMGAEPGHRPGATVMDPVVLDSSEDYWIVSENGRSSDSPRRPGPERSTIDKNYRRQIHASRLPGNSLTLGPDQVAILPLSFFPRFPPDHERHNTVASALEALQGMDSPSSSPVYVKADWEDWQGQPLSPSLSSPISAFASDSSALPFRSNWDALHETNDENSSRSYQVRTLLTIMANRGTIQIPLTASSILQNDYGIPSVIQLNTEIMASPQPNDTAPGTRKKASKLRQVKNGNHSDNVQIRIISRAQPSDQTESEGTVRNDDYEKQIDCFDLYMRHPYAITGETQEIGIIEVLVTMPDEVNVQVIAGRDDANTVSQSPRQVIRDWNKDGTVLLLRKDGRGQYIATVCASTKGVPPDTKAVLELDEISGWQADMFQPYPHSLGYLQIRTTADTLFVALERKEGPVAKKPFSTREPATKVKVKESPVGFFESFLHLNRTAFTNDTVPTNPSTNSTLKVQTAAHFLKASPASVQHLFLSQSASSSSEMWSIALVNEGQEDIKVIRASVGMQMDLSDARQEAGVTMRLLRMNKEMVKPLKGGASLVNAITLECSVEWGKLSGQPKRKSKTVQGAVLVRASPTPKRNETFVLEIPFTIQIMAGGIGVLANGSSEESTAGQSFPTFWRKKGGWISGAFYPMNPTPEDSAVPPIDPKSLHNTLRVVSVMGGRIRLNNVAILDEHHADAGVGTESLCSRFSVAVAEEPHVSGDSDEISLGRMHLVYSFKPVVMIDKNKTREILPTVCHLRFETYPKTGDHLIPLIIFTGKIDISGSLFDSVAARNLPVWNTSEVSDGNSKWHHVVAGMDGFLDWMHRTNSGSSFRSLLAASSATPSGTRWDPLKQDHELLGNYFSNLSPSSTGKDKLMLLPVVLKVGALYQGQVESWPLYLTNHNPVPIKISIDVGEVEGMTVRLGRDECAGNGDGPSVMEHLASQTKPSKKQEVSADPLIRNGKFAGHPKNGLRKFLLHGGVVNDILHQFPYCDSISLSDSAVSGLPVLKDMYEVSASGHYHRSLVAPRPQDNACAPFGGPSGYGPFDRKLSRKRVGPLMVSADGRKMRSLSACDQKAGLSHQDSKVVIPPGGVARFDVRLRSPSSTVLEKDITEFIASGLVLSTNFGELIPVLVSFEALQGKLLVTHMPSESRLAFRDNVIRVPVGLFSDPQIGQERFLEPVLIPPRNEGSVSLFASGVQILSRNSSSNNGDVPLFMRSSFSRDIYLQEILSCNPWFTFAIQKSTTDLDQDPFLGVRIGVLASTVACNRENLGFDSKNDSFPSFFRCALNWLQRRAALQPRGCGLLQNKKQQKESYTSSLVASESGGVLEYGGIEQTVIALERALETFENRSASLLLSRVFIGSGKSGRCDDNGILSLSMLKTIADAWDAWLLASESGLKRIGTSLRAIVEYTSTADEKPLVELRSEEDKHKDPEERHSLSVAISNLTVESLLEIPILCDTEKAKHFLPLATRGNDRTPSSLSFPATLVGDVSSIKIPIRNPTSVPVRVSLAAAPSWNRLSRDSFEQYDLQDVNLARFLGGFEPPFVQSQDTEKHVRLDDSNRHWWGPAGAFFHSDTQGDVTRSHQNVTIKAGSGAQFSLINPSVMFNTAFLVGCGTRCGLREEENQNQKNLFVPGMVDLTPTSPIGASAAAGSVLLGQKVTGEQRHTAKHDIAIEAGGSLMSGGRGPSAFAVAYSGLDEVIVPPYGEAELGPVLFRPPGRARLLGCRVFAANKRPEYCDSQHFETMLLLKNSLSGVERIHLRGESLWRNVIFVDPDPVDEEDDFFGSLELRNGKLALVFPEMQGYSRRLAMPVRKQVVLHNAGDVPVEVVGMSLSLNEVTDEERADPCSSGEFKLLDCMPEGFASFRLLPKENRTISIQHHSCCNKRKEYSSLQVKLGPERGNHGGVFQSDTVELALGYEKSRSAFQSCASVRQSDDVKFLDASQQEYLSSPTDSKSCKVDRTGCLLEDMAMPNLRLIPLLLQIVRATALYLIVALWVTFLIFLLLQRRKTSAQFMTYLGTSLIDDSSSSVNFMSSQTGRTWLAAFRCLARVDPTSADLQTLGREQTRQIVLLRYRMIGASPPQYFTGRGMMVRERVSMAAPKTTRPLGTGPAPASGGGNERMKTLSDGLLGKYVKSDEFSLGQLPCLLGWRVGANRGVIGSTTLDDCPLDFKTTASTTEGSSHSLAIEDVDSLSSTSGSESETFHASSQDFESSQVSSPDVSMEELDNGSSESPAAIITESLIKRNAVFSLSSPSQEKQGLVPKSAKADDSGNGKNFTIMAEQKPVHKATSSRGGVNGRHKVQDEHKEDFRSKKGKTQSRKTPSLAIANSRAKAKPKVLNAPPKDDPKPRDGSKKQVAAVNQENKTRKTDKAPRERKPRGKVGTNASSPWNPGTAESLPRTREKSTLRPPPGLAPPPGFPGLPDRQMGVTSGSSLPSDLRSPDVVATKIAVPLKEASSLCRASSESSLASADKAPPQSHPSSPVFGSIVSNSPRSPRSSGFEHIDPPVVQSGNDGFDVMAFLDDILNEGSASADDGGVLVESTSAVSSSGQPAQAFSPNPWAASSDIYQSRASAYGISIEDESNREADPVDLPLLTPEAILSASVPSEGDEEGEKIDFFAEFLGD